jgi:hypothetical protein
LNLHIIAKNVIVAILVLDALCPQPIDCFRVPHSQERSRGLREFWIVLFDDISGDRLIQRQVDHSANEMFDMCQKLIKSYEVEFCFNVCVFRKLRLVSTGACD